MIVKCACCEYEGVALIYDHTQIMIYLCDLCREALV